MMEIQIGVERARPAHPEVAEQVQAWLAGMLAIGRPQVLGLDTDAALILGRMDTTPAMRTFLINDARATGSKTGTDLAIAAIAIARSATIATNNEKDFVVINEHFPLHGLFNPLLGKWIVVPPGPTLV
jgi:predicted nucleic acid-binding protein